MSYELDNRAPLARAADESAARKERYEMRHDAESLLDKFHPQWRKGLQQWPQKAEKCPCERCNKNGEV